MNFCGVVCNKKNISKIFKIESCVKNTYLDTYTGGVKDLEVVWVDGGEEFTIEEYDGNESIQLKSETSWITA